MTRQMLWLSVSRRINGLWVGCYYKENAGASLRVWRMHSVSLKPRRYRRLLRDLERIWVVPTALLTLTGLFGPVRSIRDSF
jgi:hypothetical protein